MTARSLELIARADVILHDRLIPPGALDGAREDAELVYVGKRPGGAARSQEEIDGRLVEARPRRARASSGSRAATRSSSAAAARRPRRCAPPGSSSRSCPGSPPASPRRPTPGSRSPTATTPPRSPSSPATRIPRRPRPRSTGRRSPRFPGTLVFYMGVRRLAATRAALIDAGRDPDEPAAAIERGTLAGQRTVVATLATLAAAVEREGIGAPALIVVGPGRRPARDARLARAPPAARPPRRRHPRPRPGERPGRDPARARRRGGRAAGDPDRAAPRERRRCATAVAAIGDYALVCLTSPNGVRLLFEALAAPGLDARALAGATVAAIGPGTAAALAERGIVADVVPERFVAEALVEALGDGRGRGTPVLVARAAEARDVLPDALRERGAEVDVVALYETVREQPDPEAVEAAQGADYVTFTSSSTVRNLVEALGERLPARRPGRLDRPGDQRGRARGRPRGRASRPSATTSTAWSRRCSRTRRR